MNKHVVIGYDYSEHAALAVERGLELACKEPAHALHFLTVLDASQDYLTADVVRHQLLRRIKAKLDARCLGVPIELFVHTRIGDPVEELLSLAEDVGADLIIVGSHSRGALGRLFLGSVSEGVLRGARCPVLIAREKTYRPVTLDPVIEVEPEGFRHHPPHRYMYTTGAELLTRPNEWPI